MPKWSRATIVTVLLAGFATPRAQTTAPRNATAPDPVIAIADDYLEAYTRQFPEIASVLGLPGEDQTRFEDRSAVARQA